MNDHKLRGFLAVPSAQEFGAALEYTPSLYSTDQDPFDSDKSKRESDESNESTTYFEPVLRDNFHTLRDLERNLSQRSHRNSSRNLNGRRNTDSWRHSLAGSTRHSGAGLHRWSLIVEEGIGNPDKLNFSLDFLAADEILKRTSKEKPFMDPNIVDWDGPDDPEKPSNWPLWRKWLITIFMGLATFTITFASSVFSTANQVTAELFGVSEIVMILGTSFFILGFSLSPMIWGPISELYGRRRPLITGFVISAIFYIPVAVAQNLETVLICRFFCGFFGASALGVLGGTFADFWNPAERGFAISIFAAATFMGPLIAPTAGGFIVDSSLGWRWTSWICLIMAAAFGIPGFLLLKESYGPVILARRAKKLRLQTGNWALHAKHEEQVVNLHEILNVYLLRPSKMLFLEPILLLQTLYLAFVYGLIYLSLEAYPISFGSGQDGRGWEGGVAGLPFLAIAVGSLIGSVFMSTVALRIWTPDPAQNKPPEIRLIPMAIGAVALPIGLFWFAWTSYTSINPWPQIVSGVPIGFGVLVISIQGFNYIIDCYNVNANSAIAAVTFVRSMLGAVFPLFAGAMFRGLGVQWATSILAFVATAMVPVPLIFYFYGAKIRSWSKFVPTQGSPPGGH